LGGSSPGRGWEYFSSPLCPDRLWGPTDPPIKWVPVALSLGVKGSGREVETHLHQMPRSRMCGTKTLFPNTSSWRGAQLRKAEEQLYFLRIVIYMFYYNRIGLCDCHCPKWQCRWRSRSLRRIDPTLYTELLKFTELKIFSLLSTSVFLSPLIIHRTISESFNKW
jgi:hypothetical protein